MLRPARKKRRRSPPIGTGKKRSRKVRGSAGRRTRPYRGTPDIAFTRLRNTVKRGKTRPPIWKRFVFRHRVYIVVTQATNPAIVRSAIARLRATGHAAHVATVTRTVAGIKFYLVGYRPHRGRSEHTRQTLASKTRGRKRRK